MVTKKIYHSTLTPQEVEKTLREVSGKLSRSSVIQEWNSGSEEQVISAKILSQILTTLEKRSKGEGLKEQINNAVDSNVLTDDLKKRLESVTLNYIGVIQDVTERDKLNSASFTGGETIILLSNRFGNVSTQFFDKASETWTDLDPLSANEETIDIPTAKTRSIRSIDISKFKNIEFSVRASTVEKTHVSEGIISVVGESLYLREGPELRTDPTTPLFNLVPSLNGNFVEFRVQTLQNATKVRVSINRIF